MKRFHSILFLSLLLVASSCFDELGRSVENVSNEGKVPIIMSFSDEVTLLASTKATPGMEMGVTPAIKTIHVAVFGSSGYLKDYASAVPCDSEGRPVSGFVTTNATTGYFKVYLPFDEAPSRRRIHIIANGPESLPFNAYEDDIIKNLTVTDGNGAYWTRFETDPSQGEGILIKTTDTGSEIHRVIDGNGDYVPTDETKALFQGLTLVRNFAAINVIKDENAPGNFAIDGYTVCNMPSEGRVAIYNETSDKWIPGNDYVGLSLTNSQLTHEGTPYPGFPSTPRLNTYIPQTAEAFNAVGGSSPAGSPIFIYERANTNAAAPFVLIQARWVESGDVAADSPTYFYRLDITPDDSYAPFYRNFQYTIKISGVRIPGYPTPAEAAKRNSGDNFSLSLETQAIPDVSNGTTMIHVQQTGIAELYDPDNNTKDLWYQFELQGVGFFNGTTGSPSGGTTTVEIREIERGALDSWSVAGSDDSESKRHITYTLKEPVDKDLTSVLRIKGTFTPDGGGAPIKITRDIEITVFKRKPLSIYFSPDMVGPLANEQTTLNINLTNDLPRGIFPLDFQIEDSQLALNSSDKDVAVRQGNSIIPGSSAKTYQFHKILDWTDYLDLVEDAELSGASNPVLAIGMKTTKATDSYTIAYVSNENFVTASDTLSRDSQNYISPSSVKVNRLAHSDIVVTVFSSGSWTLSIADKDGTAAVGASLTQSYGSAGSTDVTVNIPENPGTSTRDYILTLTNTTSGITRQAIISQSGKLFELTTTTPSVKGDGITTASLSLESGYDGVWNISIPEGCTVSPSSGSGVGTTVITLTMPRNRSFDDIIRTIKAVGPDGVESSVSIIQRKAATITTGQTATFNTTSTAPSASRYSTSNRSVTINGITGTFSAIYAVRYYYMELNTNTTLTISIDNPEIEITKIVLSFDDDLHSPESNSSITVDATRMEWGRPSTWEGYWSGSPAFSFTFKRTNTNRIYLTQYVVTYARYTYN